MEEIRSGRAALRHLFACALILMAQHGCVRPREVPIERVESIDVDGEPRLVVHTSEPATSITRRWVACFALLLLLVAAIRCWDSEAPIQSVSFILAAALAVASRLTQPIAGLLLSVTGARTIPAAVLEAACWVMVMGYLCAAAACVSALVRKPGLACRVGSTPRQS